MAQFQEVSTIDEWNRFYEATDQKTLCIFKHSTTCPISGEAYREFKEYLNEQSREDVNYILVKVIESRPVSNQIAANMNVKHESPQVIVVENKEPKWNVSHWNITKRKLQDFFGDK